LTSVSDESFPNSEKVGAGEKMVDLYWEAYYLKNKDRITRRRKLQREDDEYRKRVNRTVRDYYRKEKNKLFEIPVDSYVVGSLNAGYLPVEEIYYPLCRIFKVKEKNLTVIEEGKHWELQDPPVEIRRLRTGVIRLYRKDGYVAKRKSTARSCNNPRWLKLGDKYLFVYPLNKLIGDLKRHRQIVIRWLNEGLIPAVCDRNGRFWLPEFSVEAVRDIAGEIDISPGKQRTTQLRARLSQKFKFKGPVYVY